jgi:hypothetical protein
MSIVCAIIWKPRVISELITGVPNLDFGIIGSIPEKVTFKLSFVSTRRNQVNCVVCVGNRAKTMQIVCEK